MTKAVPPGRWLSRNRAVARAEVHSAWSGISRPEVASRAERSLGVYIELLVRTRKLRPPSRRARTNRSAPGTITPSRISTPSMSHSQLQWVSRVIISPVWMVVPHLRDMSFRHRTAGHGETGPRDGGASRPDG